TYDAFGNPTFAGYWYNPLIAYYARVNTSSQQFLADERFGFQGRQFDLKTGLLYDGQRWYNASNGRFMTQDANGQPDVNPYGFAVGNPALYVAAYRYQLDGWSSFVRSWDNVL